MEYCRHENTAREMSQVWDLWEDYETGGNDYEDRGRRQIIRLVREMHDQFEFDGTYDEVD
ncbi:hypothetical protein GUY44_12090 [Pimelobacter simplex]|nr:hypothetical protein [Pimelobacter simplex]MCG8151223.1 hypothetical protein [Pimelobacter simplex]